MLLVIAYCHKDQDLALKNARLMAALGSYPNHTLMLAYNQEAQKQDVHTKIREVLAPKFGTVLPDFVPYDADERGWPVACNHLFRRLAFHVEQNIKLPFLFMEADSTALRGTFLDEVDAEYKTSLTMGKPFMGEGVCGPNPNVITHMSGIAVYPANAVTRSPKINSASATAWDLFTAAEVMPQCHYTTKIQHVFWQHYNPNVIPTFPTQESLSLIRENACIFHRNKDGTLADRLMEKLNNPAGGVGASPTEFVRSHSVIAAPETPASGSKTDNIIYTYFEPLESLDRGEHEKLIELWKEAWNKARWTPVVLTEKDAMAHPMYRLAQKVFKTYPSINPSGYDYQCFIRWLAVASKEQGMMSDYDVFPNGLGLDAPDSKLCFYSGNKTDPKIPCLIFGDADGFNHIIEHLISNPVTEKHWSDMVSLRNFEGGDFIHSCLEYSEEGWQGAQAIHFCTNKMRNSNKTPKWKFIPEILASIEPKEVFPNGMGNCVGIPQANGSIAPVKLVDQMRHHIDELERLVGGRTSRKNMLRDELKKLGFGTKNKRKSKR